MSFDVNCLANVILEIWNPTRKALAAEYWKSQSGEKEGFSPVCANKFKNGCQLGKVQKACSFCESKEYRPLSIEILNEHIAGAHRNGIYLLINGSMTASIAVDLDNHDGEKDPGKDVQAISEVCS